MAVAASLDLDDAIIAVVVAAIDANRHVSPEEGARAHHLIWSMRRFRDQPGEVVGRRIERIKALIAEHGSRTILYDAARVVHSAPLRAATFAVAVDLLLADNRIERPERRFLDELAADLRIDADEARDIVDVLLLKNSL